MQRQQVGQLGDCDKTLEASARGDQFARGHGPRDGQSVLLGPLQVLQNVMENVLAALLSNPRLVAAIDVRLQKK